MKNKKGSAILVGIFILLLLGMGIGAYAVFGGAKQSAVDTQTEVITQTSACPIAPTLSVTSVDALAGGIVATVNGYRVNGQLKAGLPASFQLGDEVEVFVNASNYISTKEPIITIEKCGITPMEAEVYATNDATIRLFNTDGNRITDNVIDSCVVNGGTNQTSSSSSISMKIEIQSAPLESTGDLVIVAEVDNSTEVGIEGITLTGTDVTAGSILSTYTQNATTSVVKAFNVPASTAGALNTYYLNIAPKSGKSLGPAGSAGTEVYVTLYSKQAFVETDNSFVVGIENKNGVVKYEDEQRFGFCIVGS